MKRCRTSPLLSVFSLTSNVNPTGLENEVYIVANHSEGHGAVHHHNPLDVLNWPTIGVAVVTWPFLNDLWAYVPGPTAFYMIVSAAFMLFQMSDKLGLLERWKKRIPLIEPPEQPEQK